MFSVQGQYRACVWGKGEVTGEGLQTKPQAFSADHQTAALGKRGHENNPTERLFTHMVKHLALGGIVLLCDGVSHGIWSHKQRVPVMRAEECERNRGHVGGQQANSLSEA